MTGASNGQINDASAPFSTSSGSGGTVSDITSTGGTITVTNPTGPTTNLDIANNTANTLAGYDNSGVFSDVIIGTNLTLSGGVLNASGGGGGAVSSVFGRSGAVSANYADYAFNLISGVASVSQGGTGAQTLSAHGVLLGEGIANVSAATTGIAARLLVDQGATDPSFQVVSGDVSALSTGAFTVLQVHGVAYPASPSTNTVPVVTGANTITYETVPNAALSNSSVTVSGVSGVTGGGTVALGSAITLGMAGNIANTLSGYNSSGIFSDVSIGSNLSLSGGILNGTVGPAPVTSVFGRTGAVAAQWNDYQFNLIGGTATASQGGTGQTSLTAHSVLLGEGVASVSFATTGIAARLLIDQGGVDPTFKIVSGDVSAISTGAFTLQAIQGTTITGTSGTSNVILSNAPTLTNPVVGTQAAADNSTKAASTAYVTSAITTAIAGVNPAVAVQAATTQASDTSSYTYNNGVSGVGATLTGPNNTALTVDGFTFTAVNQRILVKNDTQGPSGAFNGIYYVNALQTGISGVILIRALDYDQPSDINNTGAVPVVNGTANASTSWLLTSSVTNVGTDPLTYTKFSINPTTIITTSTAAGGSLTGTYPNPTIAAAAVTNSMLQNSAITIGARTGLAGGGSVALGSAITVSMGTNVANTLAGYNSSGVFSDVSIGTNLNLISGVLGTSAFSQGAGVTITYSTNTVGFSASGVSAGVSSISNTDGGSLTITPQAGAVTANLNTANANTWTATQTSSVSGGITAFIATGTEEFSIFANGNSGSGTPKLKWENGNVQSVTISGACTLGFTLPTHPSKLTVLSINTGFSYTYDGTVLWPGGTHPSFSAISNAKDITSFIYDGTTVYGVANIGFT